MYFGEATLKNVNPFALRTAKTLWSFGHSECNKFKVMIIVDLEQKQKSV